jgi:hypothetical protein
MSRALARQRRSLVGRKYSPENLQRIIKYAAETPVISTICARVGICRTSLQYYIAKSIHGDKGFDLPTGDFDENDNPITEKFHILFEQAMKDGAEKVEQEMFRLATGYDKPLSHKGRVQYQIDHEAVARGETGYAALLKDDFGNPMPETIREWDTDLMQFILKAHKPELYGTKQQIDVKHSGGVLVVGVRATSSTELEQAANDMVKNPVDVEFEVVDDDEVDPAS